MNTKGPHKVLFMNGPPHSGKDEATKIILRTFAAREYKMKSPILRALQGFFDVPDHVWLKLCNEYKENECDRLLGDIPRQAMISFSDEWVKKRYGQAALGILAIKALGKDALVPLTVVSDCGFEHEMRPIIEGFGVENCALVHLHREGCSFTGDSRNYVDPEHFPGIRYVKVLNNYDLAFYQNQITRLVKKWMGME